MKNFKRNLKYFAVSVPVMLATGAAHAAIEVPASFDTTMAELQTAGLDLADKVWPYMLAILAAFILLRLGKRFVNKIG